jgi:hypothetical protein
MGELKAEENPVLKSRPQLSFTTIQRRGECDHAWATRDTACESLILQLVVDGPLQGFMYIRRQNVTPAHANLPMFDLISIATRQANPMRFNTLSTMGSISASNVSLKTQPAFLATCCITIGPAVACTRAEMQRLHLRYLRCTICGDPRMAKAQSYRPVEPGENGLTDAQ